MAQQAILPDVNLSKYCTCMVGLSRTLAGLPKVQRLRFVPGLLFVEKQKSLSHP